MTSYRFCKGKAMGHTYLYGYLACPTQPIAPIQYIWQPSDTQDQRRLWLWLHPSVFEQGLETLKTAHKEIFSSSPSGNAKNKEGPALKRAKKRQKEKREILIQAWDRSATERSPRRDMPIPALWPQVDLDPKRGLTVRRRRRRSTRADLAARTPGRFVQLLTARCHPRLDGRRSPLEVR